MFLLDDDNNLINAECGLDLEGGDFCVVVESSGGANPKRGIKRRNPDYNKLVTTLLSRLRTLGIHVTRIVLDSEKVAHLPAATRIATLAHEYPVDLSRVDIDKFRKTLGRTIAAMHRAPGAESSGNAQKKIRICIDREISAAQLIRASSPDSATEPPVSPEGPPDMTETERQYLRAARVGQGRFRTALLERYGGRCAAAGISNAELLVASHIKPWEACTNGERLDPDNGVLLSALMDRLFDRGLITFSDDGAVISSPLLSPEDQVLCGISGRIAIQFPAGSRGYLAYHRRVEFKKGK